MDDYLDSFDDSQTAVKTIMDVVALLKLGSFDLAKYISNSHDILKEISPGNLSPKIVNIDLDKLPIERALGVSWDLNPDMLTFKVVNKNIPETKRGILSMVSSIFDPMGLISPIIVKAKLLIQKIWRRSLGWDKELPRDLTDQWNLCKNSVFKLSSLAVPRWIDFKSTETKKVELHIFADASSKAYGTSAYVNVVNNNSKHCNLVLGKSNTAPMKNKLTTIPRLELQAVLLASRIKLTVTQEMDIHIDNIYLWSDSKTVLNYLRNRNTNFGPYIIRCNEIRQNANKVDWNYIPTDLNIADVLSPGILLENPDVLSSWFTGPNFMEEASSIYNFESSENARNTTKAATANLYQELNTYTSEVKLAVTNTSSLTIFWEYYSSWNKIKRHLAWIMKLKANWLKWKRKEKKRENFNFVTCEELLKSKTYLLKMPQEESYPSELKSLLLNDIVHKSSTLVPLNPTINNQSLICVSSRVKNINIFVNSNYQVIVNKDHPIAKLIIKHYHEENLHVGREQTLS